MTITGAAMVAGVAGWPVAHSLSPLLHNAWIAAAGLDAVYVPFPVAPDDASSAFRALPMLGIRGINVTVPHKATALAAADTATPAARATGAANVLTCADGRLHADNKDVDGFLAGLEEAGVVLGEPALVLGAGGAARAAVFALIDAGVERVTVVSRTEGEADTVAGELGEGRGRVRAVAWQERNAAVSNACLIINATSAGMAGRPALDIDLAGAPSHAVAYDLVYTPLETPFLSAAKAKGLKTVGGLGMLIGQARPSFDAFFGVPPPASVDAEALLIDALGAAA